MKINIPEGKIGVMVSGGIDSAIAWYLIYSQCLEKGQTCIAFTAPKLDKSVESSTKVLQYVADKLGGSVTNPIVLGYQLPDESDEYCSVRCVMEIEKNHLVDYLFSGDNDRPNEEQRAEIEAMYSITSPEDCYPYVPHDVFYKIYDTLHEKPNSTTYGINPFKGMSKPDVLNILTRMGKTNILQDLSEITRSCINIPTEETPGHCGHCWWCKEREWAFNKIGIKDLRK